MDPTNGNGLSRYGVRKAVTYSVIKDSKSSHSSIIIMFAVIEQNALTFSNSHFFAATPKKPIKKYPVQKSFISNRFFLFSSFFFFVKMTIVKLICGWRIKILEWKLVFERKSSKKIYVTKNAVWECNTWQVE